MMFGFYGLGLMCLLAAFFCDARRVSGKCYRLPSDEEDKESVESHTDVEQPITTGGEVDGDGHA